MNRKTLITVIIIAIIGIMGYVLFQTAVEEYQNRSSAPYPLAEVNVEETVTPMPSQTMTDGGTVTNVSPDFHIEPPKYDRLPMYEFNPANNFSQEFANSLPQKLQLNVNSTAQDPVLGRVIISGNGTKNLVIYPDKGEFTYTDSAPQSSQENFNFIPNSAIEPLKVEAENFIKTLGLNSTTFQYADHSFVEATGEHAEISSQPRNANLIQLRYEARVEDLSIIDKESSLLPNEITIWLNGKGEVSRVYYEQTGTVGNEFGNYELLDENEIIKDLQTANTEAKLISGDYPIGEPIESINITSAHLAYLSVENYLAPVYILEATVRVAGNRFGTGYLLLEAIKK